MQAASTGRGQVVKALHAPAKCSPANPSKPSTPTHLELAGLAHNGTRHPVCGGVQHLLTRLREQVERVELEVLLVATRPQVHQPQEGAVGVSLWWGRFGLLCRCLSWSGGEGIAMGWSGKEATGQQPARSTAPPLVLTSPSVLIAFCVIAGASSGLSSCTSFLFILQTGFRKVLGGIEGDRGSRVSLLLFCARCCAAQHCTASVLAIGINRRRH